MKRSMITVAAALLALAAFQGQGQGQSRAFADGTPGGTGGTGTPTGSGGASGTPPVSSPPAATTSPSGVPATWQLLGKPLHGAETTADAPRMKAAVTYRDSIKPGETKFYGLVLDARSSAAVSAFAVPPTGSRGAYGDGLELKLQSPSGSRCDSQDAHFQDEGDVRPIGTAVSRLVGVGYACQQAGAYILQVHRTTDETSDPAVWPLELRYVAEPPLKGGARATPAPDFGSASPTPLLAGTPRQTDGGAGFETAAAVTTGIWKDEVLPGETRFYKVPVGWGQQLTAFADFSNAQDTDPTTFIASAMRLAVYSPVREFVIGSGRSYLGASVSIGEQLAPVSYANRAAGDDRVARVRYSGWYYLAVTVHPDVAKLVTGAEPVTLRIDVKGAVQPPPPYAADPRPGGIGVGGDDAAPADGTAPGGGSTASGPLRLVAFTSFGAGTVLLLALAAWYAAARRWAGRAAAPGAAAEDRPGAADAIAPPSPR
ncbi:hypothetical protein ACFO3J_22220 [Streptomyces polygonati]|uniref:Aromatic ring-opening dioxygenase LigA n=1 Tax=Streptomyces polygonati TaxID=1617087 RepID=A0ABV8HQ75_9ACTN